MLFFLLKESWKKYQSLQKKKKKNPVTQTAKTVKNTSVRTIINNLVPIITEH